MIYTVAIAGIVVIVAVLALTSVGHVIDAATQHFMLYYAGVFALITLCASVALGLVSTDRMFLHPGQRVFIQAAHRAASFGAVTFLIIHIVTEILAQRVHVIDSVIPFLSPFRTFYIGLGTIASDLIILLVITGIMRGRFNANGKAWRWRAIHYTSYACLVFGVWHGLLGGRPGKPYVDWSYGFVIVLVAAGLAVRVLSNGLRPKENLSAPPVDQAANSASAPLRAAAMLAQYGGTRVGKTAILGGPSTGAQPILSAPVTATVLPALPSAEPAPDLAPPYYEPGYEGPPRYLGAPRSTGPISRATTGSMPRANTGSMPRIGSGSQPRPATGPLPRTTGSLPRAGTGSLPRVPTGPMPASPMSTGPLPRAGSGPMPTMGSGALPPSATGPLPRTSSGPRPRPATGPLPREASGPRPRPVTGPFPAAPARPQSYTGPMPGATGPMPRIDDDWDRRPAPAPGPRGQAGPARWGGSGPSPVWDDAAQRRSMSGPMPVWDDSSQRRSMSGPMPTWDDPGQRRPGSGPMSAGSGPMSVWDDPGQRRPVSGPMPTWDDPGQRRPVPGPMSVWDDPGQRRSGSGPMPAGAGPRGGGWSGYQDDYRDWPEAGRDQAWLETSHDGGHYGEQPPWDGYFAESDPGLRYREPGPGMPGYRGSREHRYGGDRY